MWTIWARRRPRELLVRLARHSYDLFTGLLSGRRTGSLSRSTPRLTSTQQQILGALAQGAHLKSHRTADGAKDYRLHRADGSVLQEVNAGDVDRLRRLGLIVGNMKFPAATYLLTPAGLERAAADNCATLQPLTPR